jgi:hypothetical protein
MVHGVLPSCDPHRMRQTYITCPKCHTGLVRYNDDSLVECDCGWKETTPTLAPLAIPSLNTAPILDTFNQSIHDTFNQLGDGFQTTNELIEIVNDLAKRVEILEEEKRMREALCA